MSCNCQLEDGISFSPKIGLEVHTDDITHMRREFHKITLEMFWESRMGLLWLEQNDNQSGFVFLFYFFVIRMQWLLALGFPQGAGFVGFELLHINRRVNNGVFLSHCSDVVCPDMGQVEKRKE